MDYKGIFLNTYKTELKEIDSDVISQVKIFRNRNKNFIAVANEIEKKLREEEGLIKTSVQNKFPNILYRYKNRFNEYASDHLSYFFEHDFTDLLESYSESSLKECAIELGAMEAHSLAAANFSNSYKFLEAIYDLDKNYDQYSLNFDPNNGPENSDLFLQMQKERFTEYGQEPNWEVNSSKGNTESSSKDLEYRNESLSPGSILDKTEKIYILHLLYHLINHGSAMTTTEFLRILHLTADEIDIRADITGNPPNSRKVHEGFSKDYPKNKKIELIEKVIAKTHRYQLPRLKQILNDKLKALTTK